MITITNDKKLQQGKSLKKEQQRGQVEKSNILSQVAIEQKNSTKEIINSSRLIRSNSSKLLKANDEDISVTSEQRLSEKTLDPKKKNDYSENNRIKELKELMAGDYFDIEDPEYKERFEIFINDAKENGWQRLGKYVEFYQRTMVLGDLPLQTQYGSNTEVKREEFIQLLVKELGIREDIDYSKKEAFANDILKTFSVINKTNNPREALTRAIWTKMSDYICNDKSFNSSIDDDKSIGLLQKSEDIEGFRVHFSNRLKAEEIELMTEKTKKITQSLMKLDKSKLGDIIKKNLKNDIINALTTLKHTTQDTTNSKTIEEISNYCSKSHQNIEMYAEAVVNSMKELLNSKRLHIVFDSAMLDDVFGKSIVESGIELKPSDMMSNDKEIKDGSIIIMINIDAHTGENFDDYYSTFTHELGHAIGYNPYGAMHSGHFRELDRYLEFEDIESHKKEKHKCKIPKIFFDAYYFETLMKNLQHNKK